MKPTRHWPVGASLHVTLGTSSDAVWTAGGLYVAASVAGTGLSLTRTIQMGLLLFIMVTCILVGSTLGWVSYAS